MSPDEVKRIDDEVANGFRRLGLPSDCLASNLGNPNIVPELPSINQPLESPTTKVQFVLRSTST